MTKNIRNLTILLTGIFLFSACAEDSTVKLFNGKDLSNWNMVLFDSEGVAEEIFQVEDDIIKVAGTINGYIATKESYSNYKLHVEWRWDGEPSNSGVLVHVQEANMVEWPLCIEAQLKHPNAGDLVFIGHGSGATVGDSIFSFLPEERRYKSSPRMEESSENPPGEWNSYDITCDGNNLELIVNGVVQNTATKALISSGPIALQSEGSPIEFRNVYLIPIEE